MNAEHSAPEADGRWPVQPAIQACKPLSCFALQELTEADSRIDNAERLGALPSLPIGPNAILNALHDSRAEH